MPTGAYSPGSNGSEVEQDPEAVLDLGHRVGGDAALPAKQSLDRKDTKLLAHSERMSGQSSLGRKHGDMRTHLPVPGRKRDNGDELAWAAIMEIGGDDHGGATASLFSTTSGIKVGYPDITTDEQRFGHSTHVSSSRPSISVPSMLLISA